MLARRFTIVCLLITLFGMFFSMLVARAGRPPRVGETGVVTRCVFDQGFVCAPSDKR
jgi:hypothetical protein